MVTGATRGIGQEVARQLAEQGATVLVTGRDPAAAAATAANLAAAGDVRSLQIALDVTDDDSIAAAAAACATDPGRLDILVNNAAASVDWSGTASKADLIDAKRIFETNLFGTWSTTMAFLPLLHQSDHPRIVNVSSGAGSHGDPQYGFAESQGTAAAYRLSKAALNALTHLLAVELADTRILVNAACPGPTATWEGAAAAGARPVAEGAASVVWVAALPDDAPSGGFFRDGKPVPW
jgi:NAD(P)-dependent dehydrogenase (short-subunit alcohol dehydrogenase family)